MKKLHLCNETGTRTACGRDPQDVRSAADHVIITCAACVKLVEKAGQSGEMLKGF